MRHFLKLYFLKLICKFQFYELSNLHFPNLHVRSIEKFIIYQNRQNDLHMDANLSLHCLNITLIIEMEIIYGTNF